MGPTAAQLEATKGLVVAIANTINATETDPRIIIAALSMLAAQCAAENLNQKGRKQFIEKITKGTERFASMSDGNNAGRA